MRWAIHEAFEKAVVDFLDDYAERGVLPEKPVSGKLMLRIRSEVHAAVSIAAQAGSKSINQWADEVLERAAKV